MAVPSRLTLYNVAVVFDGGTRHLYATDERGAEHRITLAQRFQQTSDPRQLPGRPYFDDDLVAVRSELTLGAHAEGAINAERLSAAACRAPAPSRMSMIGPIGRGECLAAQEVERVLQDWQSDFAI